MNPPYGRRSGKTTRTLLAVASAISRGERVVVILPTAQQARSFARGLFSLLEHLGGEPQRHNDDDVMCWAGFARITADQERLRGCTFNQVFHDGSNEIFVRTQVVDVNHFETEFDPKEDRARSLSSRS